MFQATNQLRSWSAQSKKKDTGIEPTVSQLNQYELG